jgi:16S rRNA processing protein RimM
MTETYMEVGRVVGPHGVSGKVKVEPWSGDPSGLLSATRLRIAGRPAEGDREIREFDVKSAHRSGGYAVFSLEGVGTEGEARLLSGAGVSMRREELPPPGEDEYYWTDLVGCEVVDREGGRLGAVVGMTDGPAHDWLVVRRGDDESFLPLISEFILEVDVAGRRIVAAPPAGW